MGVGVELDAWVELGKKLDRHSAALERIMEQPIIKPVGGSIVVPTGFTSPVMCRLNGSPARGRIWEVLKVNIFGADPHTAIASVVVDVYAGYVPPVAIAATAVPGGFQEVIVSGASVPSINNMTTEVEYCRSGEEIFALFYGAGVVAGVQFEVVARVKDRPERAVESWIA